MKILNNRLEENILDTQLHTKIIKCINENIEQYTKYRINQIVKPNEILIVTLNLTWVTKYETVG